MRADAESWDEAEVRNPFPTLLHSPGSSQGLAPLLALPAFNLHLHTQSLPLKDGKAVFSAFRRNLRLLNTQLNGRTQE